MSLIEIILLSLVGIIILSLIIFLKIYFNDIPEKAFRSFQSSLIFFMVVSGLLVIFDIYLKSYFTTITNYFDLIEFINLLWWIALFFIIKNSVAYFIWYKTFEKNNVFVPKIFKDLIYFILFILILGGIIHFVFKSSIVTLFTASGVLAVIFGYSAQTVLGDIFAGIALNIYKQFKVDDWINILGLGGFNGVGKVLQLNTRFVQIITLNGDVLSIPNSLVAKQPIINLSEPAPIMEYNFEISVSNIISPVIIKNLLVESAIETATVMDEPKPVALLISMNGSEYTYQLHVYSDQVNEKIVLNEVLSIFWYKCRRRKIKISKDLFEETLNFSKDDIKKVLKKIDIFSVLNVEELQMIIETSSCSSFGPPERILRQGQKNKSMFVILKGGVDIYLLNDELKIENKVASLVEGTYFGEMSLLTGAPCSASIYANQETLIIEISQQVMKQLFTNRHELMEKISKVIVERQLMNKQFEDKEKMEKHAKEMVTPLLNLIQKIFS